MELTAEERAWFAKHFSRPTISNRQIFCYEGTARRVYEDLHWQAEHGDLEDSWTAKQILLKLLWHPTENDLAAQEGWFVGLLPAGIVRAAYRIKVPRFASDEEAASHVKESAARGDVLAQKAIIEIARRQLSGNRQND